MRRFVTLAAIASGMLLLAPTAADAAPQTAAKPAINAKTTAQAAAQPKIRVTYPKAVRRGGSIVFTFKVIHAKQVGEEALVIVSNLSRDGAARVRFLKRPPHSRCGFRKDEAYCVIRPISRDSYTIQYRVTLKFKYGRGNFQGNHYWAGLSLGGASVNTYLKNVFQDNLIGRSKTKIVA